MTGRTIFKDAHVFDGTSFRSEPHHVVLEDGMISRLAPIGTLGDLLPGDTVVECQGKTVMPGLIDCHVHVMVDTYNPMAMVTKPFSLPFYESVGHLRRTLEAGVTTARDAGGADLGVREAIESGLIAGPRLKLAVAIMSQTGGHADGWVPSGTDMSIFGEHPGRPSGVADGLDEVRRTTRRLLRAGADQIKICSTGGVMSPSDDPRHSQFSPDEIRVIVEEAENQGKYVMAHAQGTQGIRNALNAGVRSIEHGIYLDDETIELMLEKDAFLVPTLVAPLSVVRNAEAGHNIPPLMVQKAINVIDDHKAAVAKAIGAGVKIAMGTDSGVGPHGHNTEELHLMAEAGLSLEGALAAGTSVAGELTREPVGRLAAGQRGDVLVLDRELNRTGQLASLQENISAVYQGGVRVV
ncbi:amidohydrolase family protein [Saxibacter everestensis]|uniref:Amidohydrolase family protein n=1 Tax=Saxibacter everestensis TaxID=2909229 RepID=A0ABY8QRL2_9MICO|nr:amidohydrolase family protein [Brevibacteriaceae bacterium ZFBP1038]